MTDTITANAASTNADSTDDDANALSRCRRAVESTRAVVDTVRTEDLDAATPCAGWDVRQLLGHMTGVGESFADALRGGSVDAGVGGAGDEAAGNDPRARFYAAIDDAMQEWESPGALDRTLQLPLGPTPGAMAIRFFTADHLIHAWDLARALGRNHRLDEDLSAHTLDLMHSFLKPEMRGPERGFDRAVPVADDAPIQERLLGFSGRTP